MAYETRELSGQLFKNQNKTTDGQPNARGEARINDILYEVSAWTKKDKNGNPWQSLAFKRKEAKPAVKMDHADLRDANFADFDDDVPF